MYCKLGIYFVILFSNIWTKFQGNNLIGYALLLLFGINYEENTLPGSHCLQTPPIFYYLVVTLYTRITKGIISLVLLT